MRINSSLFTISGKWWLISVQNPSHVITFILRYVAKYLSKVLTLSVPPEQSTAFIHNIAKGVIQTVGFRDIQSWDCWFSQGLRIPLCGYIVISRAHTCGDQTNYAWKCSENRQLKGHFISKLNFIKTVVRYRSTPIRMPQIGTLTTPNADQDVEPQELPLTAGWGHRWRGCFGRRFVSVLQK